jgi:hypothetical protein
MSITAMKQALEALEYLLTYTKGRDDEKIAWDAITALRQAIEQAEKPNLKQVIYLYDEPQMEMSKQEPMPCKKLCDWCVNSGYDFCANAAKTTPIPNPQEADQLAIAYLDGLHQGKKKREWVEITDEEIGMAFRKVFPVGVVLITKVATEFARAIEQASKEKNGF